MNGKRQKTRTTQQLRLAFAAEGRDESPDDRYAGTVPSKANSRPMSPTSWHSDTVDRVIQQAVLLVL